MRTAHVGAVVCASIAFAFAAQPAQATDDKTRQEIQAVKDYVSRRLAAQPAPSVVRPPSPSKEYPVSGAGLAKTEGMADRKSVLMNGNKITVRIFNYGGIGPGYGLVRGLDNLIWRNIDYIFQFCPLVGASVVDSLGRRRHIISDGLYDYPTYNLREVDPTGQVWWTWQPLPEYADPTQSDMASNPAPDRDKDGKPDSWPRSWYNPTLGKYVWPGYLSQDVPSADLEAFWAMDDRDNAEFPYYPFMSNPSRRGLGLQVDGRAFQWSNPLAENCVFFVYTITNISDQDLDSVFFGIYGDPDLGGASPENTDDWGLFIPPYPPPSDTTGEVENIPVYSRSLVYFWDPDMMGARQLPLGYIGCKFLESPGNPNNGIDDDGDGLIDERQDDGIDNDRDWNPANDDFGIDGIPNTGDTGEGDGVPTAGVKRPDGSLDPLFPGELNFELTDLDESDQIGLTSFNSWSWPDDRISDDESMWNRCKPRNFGEIQNDADITFIFGSGYISLKKGETKRISMALLVGQTLDDLLTSAKTVQTIYNNNYRFFRPPVTPTMTAVPDDKKVTLYWDNKAEQSLDPIAGKDFEGYVIYRSTDPSFNDVQTVTDGRGAQFLTEPLRDLAGFECKWDVATRDDPYVDLNLNGRYDTGEPYVDTNGDGRWTQGYADPWKGYHPVPYQDRGVHYYLGNNRGLVHSYVDSNSVINGQTYYYALVAYDHGDSVGVPPTESPKKITVDPITNELTFDINTAQVIPGPRSNGYVPPEIQRGENVTHSAGIGTGDVTFAVLNDLAVKDGNEYRLTFADSLPTLAGVLPLKNYSVLDLTQHTDLFVAYDTNFAALSHTNVAQDEALRVTDRTGATTYAETADYVINYARGSIRRTGASRMPSDSTFRITYQYYPVFQSQRLDGSDGNDSFDGIRLLIADQSTMAFDPDRSGWVAGSKSNLLVYAKYPPSVGAPRAPHPADYRIRWSSSVIDSAEVIGGRAGVPYLVEVWTGGVSGGRVPTFLHEPSAAARNKKWDPGEEIILYKPGSTGARGDTLTWGVIVSEPVTPGVSPILPTDGDLLDVGTKRPFTSEDIFHLRTVAGRVDPMLASSQLDNIYVVPNPYVGYSEIEPKNRLPGETRGERRIYFENLPPQCTIRIFTLNGDLVTTLYHDSGMASGREFWNLLNREGFSVAYGVYVAHVDAPGIGEKILKFALIK